MFRNPQGSLQKLRIETINHQESLDLLPFNEKEDEEGEEKEKKKGDDNDDEGKKKH